MKSRVPHFLTVAVQLVIVAYYKCISEYFLLFTIVTPISNNAIVSDKNANITHKYTADILDKAT